MSGRRLLFFGGNGHNAARLTAARAASARRGVAIDDVPYPGFEGRPRTASLQSFLDAIAAPASEAPVLYATGIGGLLVLALRARGALRERRVLLQAPVLWGLEHRSLPRLLRAAPLRRVASWLFTWRAFQSAFARRYFTRRLERRERDAFFDGYARCPALPDLFAWLTPSWLRELEAQIALDRAALDNVEVWWGGRDRVVTLQELRTTETALDVRWPVRVFPDWGHYPMIDQPEEWAAAVAGLDFRPAVRR